MENIDEANPPRQTPTLNQSIIDDINKEMVQIPCAVNYNSIYSDKLFKTWKCIECDMDLICEGCKDCHKNHQGCLRETSLTALSEQLCGCFQLKHKVTQKKSEAKVKAKHCPLSQSDVSSIYSSLFYQRNDNPNEVFCFYCYKTCIPSAIRKDYTESTMIAGKLKCSCSGDTNHKGSLYSQRILDFFNYDNQTTPPIRLAFNLLQNDSIANNAFYVLNNLNRKIANSLTYSKENSKACLSLNSRSEEKQKSQMKKFIKCLKVLKSYGKGIFSITEISDTYSIKNTLEILKVKDLKGRIDFLIYLQMFYLRVFRYIHFPTTQDIYYYSNNVSSFHRILLSKKSTDSKEDSNEYFNRRIFDDLVSLFELLKDIISNVVNPKDVIPEYIKLLHCLIDIGRFDLNRYGLITEKYMMVLIEGLKKVSVIDACLSKKIGKLFERLMYYQNDYCIYYKIFKKTLRVQTNAIANDNTKEEIHYSFESTKIHLNYLELLFNKNTEIVDIAYDYNMIIDNITNSDESRDDFADSLYQITKSGHSLPLDQSLKDLFAFNCIDYIKNQSLQKEYETMIQQIKQIEEMAEKIVIDPREGTSEAIIEEINKLKEMLQKFLKDPKHKQSCQLVFIASRSLSKLITIFNILYQLNNEQKNPKDPKKKDTASKSKQQKQIIDNAYRDTLYSIIFLLCDNNPFITVLFFNHHRNKNNKCPYLYLRSTESLSFYSTLLQTLHQANYKINTELFAEIFGMFINKIVLIKKSLKANEFTLFIKTAKQILNVSNDKSYHVSCQSISTSTNQLALYYKIAKDNYESVLHNPITSYSGDHVSLLYAYFGFINDLDNDTFDTVKYIFDNTLLGCIKNKINEPIDMGKLVPLICLMRSELMLFYSKYHFGSLHTNKDNSLLDYSNIQISMETIQPFFEYIESFTQRLHSDLTEMELMSCFIKGVAIPSFLLIWKINSLGILDGVAKYIFYNVTFWLLNCFKVTLDQIIHKINTNQNNSLNAMRIKAEIASLYLGDNCDIEKLSEMINKEHDEIKQEDFSCLNNRSCVQKVLKVMNSLKFFQDSQKLMKRKQSEYERNYNDNNDNEIEIRSKKIKDQSVLGQLQRQIEKYTKLKEKDSVLLELFRDTKENSNHSTIAGSLLINLLSRTKDSAYEKEAICVLNLLDINKIRYLSTIINCFHLNPKFWQELILANIGSSYIIKLFTTKAIKAYAQLVYADYGRILGTNSPYYTLLLQSLEFLRLLCEDHNPYFQTILIQNGKFFNSNYDFISLIFDMSFEITKHVRHYSMQETLICPEKIKGKRDDKAKEKSKGKDDHNGSNDHYILHDDKNEEERELKDIERIANESNDSNIFKCFSKKNYFNLLSDKLCDIQIELIQGTKIDNLIYISQTKAFDILIKSYSDFLEYCTDNQEYASIAEKYLKFLNCFIEEILIYKHCDLTSNISLLLQNINAKKYIDFGEKSFFKMIISKIKDRQVKEKITLSIIKQNLKEKNKIQFYNTVKQTIEKLKANIYIHYDDITSNPFFMNCFYILLFITRIKDYRNDPYGQYEQIITSLILAKNEERYSGLYYDFCSFLLLDNEVVYTLNFEKSPKETEKYTNLFKTILMQNSNKEYREVFNKTMIEVGGSNNKKQTNRLKIYYLTEKDSVLLKDSDFKSFDKVAIHEDYYTKLSGILNHYKEYSITIDMRKLLLDPNPSFINKFNEMNYSSLEIINCFLCLLTAMLLIIRSPGNIFEMMLFYYEIIHLSLLGILMTIFFVGNTYKIKRFSENEENKWEKVLTTAWDSRILPFEWTFLWGILGLKFNYLLSLQLFVIFKVSPTMKSALLSIKTRIKQFAATGFLLIILMFLYSSLTLYFFAQKSDMTYWCASYWECFFYMMNNGIRGGGLGFDQKIMSQPGYWNEFIYSWIFYFLIILIIMNIINGIIVDTFQALREQNNDIATSRKDICFICQLERSEFEHKELDFEYHVTVEHNVMNYFRYLFKLHRNDSHDLNAVDYQVFNSIKAGRVDFFPIEKANGFEEDSDNDNDTNDKDTDDNK